MSQRARKNYHHLKVLAVSKPNQVKELLNSNFNISRQKKKKLAAHKKHLIKLATRGIPLQHKRNVLVQNGGNFLSLILPAAITVLEKFLK